MAKRQSKVRTTLIATFWLLVCVALPWVLPSAGCSFEFNTAPERRPMPVIKPSADDADSGEERVS